MSHREIRRDFSSTPTVNSVTHMRLYSGVVNQPSNFVSIPRTLAPSRSGVLLAFETPMILKPASGAGSEHVCRIEQSKDLTDKVTSIWSNTNWGPYRTRDLIVESWCSGEDYHADGFVLNGKTNLISVSKYFEKHVTQHGVRGRLGSYVLPKSYNADFYNEISFLTSTIIENLGLNDCIFHIEFLVDDSRITFVEIASRIGGSGALAKSIEFGTGQNPNTQFMSLLLEKDLVLGRKSDYTYVGFAYSSNGLSMDQENSFECSTSQILWTSDLFQITNRNTLDFTGCVFGADNVNLLTEIFRGFHSAQS